MTYKRNSFRLYKANRLQNTERILKGSPEQLKASTKPPLRPEIRGKVKLHRPRDLYDAMDLAQLVEDQGQHKAKPSQFHNQRQGSNHKPFFQRDNTQPRPSSQLQQQPQRPAQTEQRRQDNKCFRCREPWRPGHRCAERAARIIEGPIEEGDKVEESNQVEGAEVSLNSVAGLTPSRAMKLKGNIGDKEVTILVDSGATHNFISPNIVKDAALKVIDQGAFKVTLGTGITQESRGFCPNVEVCIAEHKIKADFLPLALGGTDVILGMQWLESLGDMKVNWKALSMEFKSGGHRVRLNGEPSLKKTESSFQAIVKGMKTISACYLVRAEVLKEDEDSDGNLIPDSIAKILEEFPTVFQEPKGLPPIRGHEHAIILKDGSTPISNRPYRYPQIQKDEIEKMVREMLQAGIIRPSSSPYSSPILLVKKKDGGWRFCVDYRALNKQTVPDKFPIPVIDELLDELHGSVIFSKIDLKSGYHQIRMAKGDEQKTAFRTHEGQYEFLVMPFGLTNAPATFQALMNQVFKPWLRKFVLVFFDDILVYSKSEEEHKEHLRLVLGELSKHELCANMKKCSFGQPEIEYLGHVVSKEGVSADQLKIQAMQNWPEPRTLKELRGFLGLTGYYRKFVQNYGKIAQPLTEQLKKDAFKWNPAATEAFKALKKAMTEVPVLALPDFSQPFVLETDASGYGLGAVLMQNQRPIAYWSQVLSNRARQKSVYERELMAIALAVTKWRPYLLGRTFVVRTDQKSLKFLLEQRLVAEEHQRWLTKLLGYNFDIHYKPGLENKAADALSRKVTEENAQLKAATVHRVLNWDELSKDNEGPDLDQHREAAKQGDPRYTLAGTRLFYKGRFMLPPSSPQIPPLLKEFHGSTVGGHSGVLKTYQRIASEFYWPGMKKDIRKMVAECEECQRSKYVPLAPAGLLQPLNIPTQVWSEVSMDFIEGLPKSEGYSVILVVVDRLSKYAHFIPLAHPYTAISVSEVFMKEIVRLHGIPEAIVSDRDAVFLSTFWQQLFKGLGTSLKRSSAYHPQTDGQTEVVNRSVGTYLRCFAAARQRNWVKLLPWAEYWYNTSFHTSTQTTPYKVLYGRDPPKLIPYEQGSIPVQQVEATLVDRDEVLAELMEHLAKARQQMKGQADKHRRDVNFKVGDFVYLKLQPGRQVTRKVRVIPKLAPRYYGPYEIEQRIGEVAYRLKLPKEAQVHPVFHVSQLKPAKGPPKDPSQVQRLKWYPGYQSAYQPEGLRGIREGQQGREVLIKWTRLPEHDSTWELMEDIEQLFPDFDLEDKVFLWEAGRVEDAADMTRARAKSTEVPQKMTQAKEKSASQVSRAKGLSQEPRRPEANRQHPIELEGIQASQEGLPKWPSRSIEVAKQLEPTMGFGQNHSGHALEHRAHDGPEYHANKDLVVHGPYNPN